MYSKYVKRTLDVVFSFFMILGLLPVLLLVAFAILLEGSGEILFKQDRIGINGKIFRMYKFRTMKWDRQLNKPSITKFGYFLRKTSIDELPQLFNILKGDMSFIGPRPWISEYLMYFTPNQKKRCEVKPGISGWAQVNGRNGLTIIEKIKLDIWYVDNISVKTDIKILFLTVKTVLIKESAELPYTGIDDELSMLKENYNLYSSFN